MTNPSREEQIKELIGFFAEESARLRMLIAMPSFADKLDLYFKESEKSLERYPLVKAIKNNHE